MSIIKTGAIIVSAPLLASFSPATKDASPTSYSSDITISAPAPTPYSSLQGYKVVPSIIPGSLTVSNTKHNVTIQLDSGADGDAAPISIGGTLASEFNCEKHHIPEDEFIDESLYPGMYVDNDGKNKYVCDGTVTVEFQSNDNQPAERMTLPVIDLAVIILRPGEVSTCTKENDGYDRRPVVSIPRLEFGGLVYENLTANIANRQGFDEQVLISARFLHENKILPLAQADDERLRLLETQYLSRHLRTAGPDPHASEARQGLDIHPRGLPSMNAFHVNPVLERRATAGGTGCLLALFAGLSLLFPLAARPQGDRSTAGAKPARRRISQGNFLV